MHVKPFHSAGTHIVLHAEGATALAKCPWYHAKYTCTDVPDIHTTSRRMNACYRPHSGLAGLPAAHIVGPTHVEQLVSLKKAWALSGMTRPLAQTRFARLQLCYCAHNTLPPVGDQRHNDCMPTAGQPHTVVEVDMTFTLAAGGPQRINAVQTLKGYSTQAASLLTTVGAHCTLSNR